MEKIDFPLKTKIAAWWAVLVCTPVIIFFGSGFYSFLSKFFCDCLCPTNTDKDAIELNCFCNCSLTFYPIVFVIVLPLVTAIFVLLAGIDLLKGKKWAWYGVLCGNIGQYSLVVADFLSSLLLNLSSDIYKPENIFFFAIFSLIFLIPVFLLFIDKKSFFKIVA